MIVDRLAHERRKNMDHLLNLEPTVSYVRHSDEVWGFVFPAASKKVEQIEALMRIREHALEEMKRLAGERLEDERA
jgi:hypothetical protein